MSEPDGDERIFGPASPRARCCLDCGDPLSANERAQEFRVHIRCLPHGE